MKEEGEMRELEGVDRRDECVSENAREKWLRLSVLGEVEARLSAEDEFRERREVFEGYPSREQESKSPHDSWNRLQLSLRFKMLASRRRSR